MKNRNDIIKEFFLVLILVLLGILYSFYRIKTPGVPHYEPQDTYFHFNRLIGLSNVWHSPVNFNSFGANGTYVNFFYPWLTMYPMWLIYERTESFTYAYEAYYLLLTLVNILISYYVMRKITSDRVASFCFAVLYTYSSYRFVCIYLRESLGECISITILPIVFLGIYNILYADYSKWISLSVGMILLAYSHILSLIITSALIVILALASLIFMNDRINRLKSFIKATVCAMIGSLGFLVPMLQAMHDNDVYHPEGTEKLVLSHLYGFGRILWDSVKNKPVEHTVGLIMIICFVVSTISVFVNKDIDEQQSRIIKILLLFSLILLFCASSLFPWKYICKFPAAIIIQFPWRFHAYTSLFVTAAFSMLMSQVLREKGKVIVPIVVSVVCIGLFAYSTYCLEKRNHVTITDSSIVRYAYRHKDYSPVKAKEYYDKYGNTLDIFYINGEKADPRLSVSEDGGTIYIHFDNSIVNPEIDVPMYYFSTVRAKVNGEAVNAKMSKRGTVLINAETDKNLDIEIYHEYTPLTYISWIVSALFCVGLLVYGVVTGLKKNVC